jgi:hypothetical protein
MQIAYLSQCGVNEKCDVLHTESQTISYKETARGPKAAGFLTPVGCHTWRATGITIYLENNGRLKHAQQMAGHESPRTTKLYDRTKDEITLSEVERIRLCIDPKPPLPTRNPLLHPSPRPSHFEAPAFI